MSTDIRAAVVGCVDGARGIVDDLGLRPFVVTIRTRTWSGSERGDGTATDVDLVIDPAPLVKYPSPYLIANSPGKYEDGDRMVQKVTRALTESQLICGKALIAAEGATVERFFLIDGDDYRLIGEPEKRNLEWRLKLRRMRQR